MIRADGMNMELVYVAIVDEAAQEPLTDGMPLHKVSTVCFHTVGVMKENCVARYNNPLSLNLLLVDQNLFKKGAVHR